MIFFFHKNIKKKSLAWDYAWRKRDRAFYNLCDNKNNKYSYVGNTTQSLLKNLRIATPIIYKTFVTLNHQKNL